MKTRIGIVADDLTGAGDTAVQFVRAGWRTDLLLHADSSDADVVAVTTDSRTCAAAQAADAVRISVKQLKQHGITHLYKKVDSTLRGQIRAEVDAALANWSPRAVAVVCPAFPAMDRTVVTGELRVGGVPVAQTSAATDPITPVKESHLPTLLGGAQLPNISGEPAQQLADRIKRCGNVVVVDAATERDMQRIAEAVVLLGPDAIPVGSAGLARHLATAWREVQEDAQPAIVVVTSLQETARRQAAAVEAAGATRFEPALRDLMDAAAWKKWSEHVVDRIDAKIASVLIAAPNDRSMAVSSDVIPRRFADLIVQLVERRRCAGIAVTGGDGARAIVAALDAKGISLHDEVATGIPYGTLRGGTADGLPIVTKAGGFGADDVLVRAVERLRVRRVW